MPGSLLPGLSKILLIYHLSVTYVNCSQEELFKGKQRFLLFTLGWILCLALFFSCI
jgi:hypothetical protein